MRLTMLIQRILGRPVVPVQTDVLSERARAAAVERFDRQAARLWALDAQIETQAGRKK